MQTVLIAHGSEELTNALAQMLGGQFHVTCCADGRTALHYLQTLQPEILILDFMLPYKDGLTVLEEVRCQLPKVILGIVRDRSYYALRSAAAHGVGYVMLEPCETRAVVVRLMDMIASADLPPQDFQEPQSEITRLLLQMGFRPGLDGFTQLCVGIPLFAADTAQRLSKELYPAIIRLCGYSDVRQVEHSIRTAIKTAWKSRDPVVWQEYFPSSTKPPCNKVFISRLAAAFLETKSKQTQELL